MSPMPGEADRVQRLLHTPAHIGRLGRPCRRGPNATSSQIRSAKIWWSGFWKTSPTRRLRAVAGWPRRLFPSSRMSPAVGARIPFRCLTSVVFPLPFWPRMATNSPRRMAQLTPASASVPSG